MANARESVEAALMKIWHSIGPLHLDKLMNEPSVVSRFNSKTGTMRYSPVLIEWLEALSPSIAPGVYQSRKIADVDPLVNELKAVLTQVGLKPSRHGREPETYRYTMYREYEKAEIDTASLVQPIGPWVYDVGDSGRDASGRLRLMKVDNLLKRPSPLIARTGVGWIVSSNTRRAIESAKLKHIIFKEICVQTDRPAHINYPVVGWRNEWGEPWMEMTTDLWMPIVSPSCDVYADAKLDTQNRELIYWNRAYSGPTLNVQEGFFDLPQLLYRQSDLEKMMPLEWDLALTREGSDRDHRYHLICSQRFRHFTEGIGIDASYLPVHIERNL